MTLDEAIKMYTNNAEYERIHGNLQGYFTFKQLARWLKELIFYQKRYKAEREVELETDMKYWISDGSLKCPDCNCIVYPMEIENGDYNYCPNCGTRLYDKAESEE